MQDFLNTYFDGITPIIFLALVTGQLVMIFGSSSRKILIMRTSLVIGAALGIIYTGYTSKLRFSDPDIYFSSFFIIINLYHVIMIYIEKLKSKIDAATEQVRLKVFPKMDKNLFCKLMNNAELVTMEENDTLSIEGKPIDYVYITLDGAAKVEAAGKLVAIISTGQFIGEMSFLTGKKPSATVTAATEMKVYRWKKEKLAKLMKDDPILDSDLKAVFSNDLVHKLVVTNAN